MRRYSAMPARLQVVLEDSAESDGTIADLLQRLCRLGVGEFLYNGLDVVLRGKIKHLAHVGLAANGVAGQGQTTKDEGHDVELEVFGGHTTEVHVAVRAQKADVLVDVEATARDGDDQEVEATGGLLHCLVVCGVDEALGAQLLGEVSLAGPTGEGIHIGAHLRGELDGEVTKATEPNNTNGLAGAVSAVEEVADGFPNGGTSAHERADKELRVAIGDLEQLAAIGADEGAEASVVGVFASLILYAAEVGEAALGADVVEALLAVVAGLAALADAA